MAGAQPPERPPHGDAPRRRVRPRTASDLPGLDLAERQSWQNFLDAALRLWPTLDRHLAGTDRLCLVDIQVLDVLVSSSTGSARLRELADTLDPTASQLTKRIRNLEERGLVRRELSPTGGRTVAVQITDDGRTLVEHATLNYVQGVRTHLFGALSRRQVVTIAENCQRISGALNPPDSRVR